MWSLIAHSHFIPTFQILKNQIIKMNSTGDKLPPHVLIFPYPAQGHLNCMLNLAHLLCLADFHVTFIVSDFSHRRLLKHTSVSATFAAYPGFQFRPIPDGLPDDHPRCGDKVFDLFAAADNTMVPLLKKMMADQNFLASDRRRPVTCFIADGFLCCDYAEEEGIPHVYFRTPSASYLWASLHFNDLVQAQEIPIGGRSMDGIVKGIAGMEGILRRRDLPSFCRVTDIYDPQFQSFLGPSSRKIVRAQAAIFNTFQDLEGPIISQIQNKMPRIFAIGPIHEQLKSRLMEKKSKASITAGNFWAEDRSCIDWLDAQPPRSVIYVSFGSITVVTREQLLEFWHGLVSSEQRFLWVIRPDSIVGDDGNDQISAELMERCKGKCFLIEWAPQEEVLNHQAVGGFLTHSGWNSTLESIVAGVPMICWPFFGDQTINSRFVSESWKIGLDIKDTCDRFIIEKAIREIMIERKEEFLEKAGHMAKLAKKAVSQGGSSYCDFDSLVDYIKSLPTT